MEGRPQLLQEGVSLKIRLSVEFVLSDLHRRPRAQRPRLARMKRRSQEILGKSFFNCLKILRRPKTSHTPRRQSSRDPVVILLGYEFIEPRLHLSQYGIERAPRTIVRMENKRNVGRTRKAGMGKRFVEEIQFGQADGKHHHGRSLAAAEQKAATGKIYGIRLHGRQRYRLFYTPTQSCAPGRTDGMLAEGAK
jgi:hypothetical protein